MHEGCSLFPTLLKAPEYDSGPYALTNFLPAGTLVLSTSSDAVPCDFHDSKGWHGWPGYAQLTSIVQTENHDFLRLLDFLTFHKFIDATCKLQRDSKLFIRVYLIPFDLADVGGLLRRRDGATVLQPARKYLRALLLRITRDPGSWGGSALVTSRLPFFSEETDNRTLAEIYNTLPSPSVRDDLGQICIQNVLCGEGIISGMRTRLYEYQRRSVVAMLEREMYPGTIPDPLFVPIHGVRGTAEDQTFYLQPATMEVLRERPFTARVRGGILCEELGTGKTVMTLALVASTIDQLPAPEESILDLRPVLTPLAFRHFPSAEFVSAREKLAQGNQRWKTTIPHEKGPRIPSLVEHLIHYCRVHSIGFHLRDYESELEARSLWQPLQKSTPFYYHYDKPLESLRSSRKHKATPPPKRMYLTSATLIVVPPNLYNQWVNEINKHCDDRVTARIYRATNNALPAAEELSSAYDIVLLTHARLSTEAQKTAIENQHSWKVCLCPEMPHNAIRIPDCKCIHRIKDVSPLLQVRWKRLVIDEGHVAGTTTTNLMAFIKILSIERKWIVTGTPTTNLMGLHFGEGSELMYPEDPCEYPAEMGQDIDEQYAAMDTIDDTLAADTEDLNLRHSTLASSASLNLEVDSNSQKFSSSSLATPDSVEDRSPSPRNVRVWTRNDREDLHKMGNMISSFLELPAFATDSKLFTTHLIAPLMDSSGPRPGSVQVLTQVMESVMLRHRIEDVEKEILLPLLSQETVLLDLDHYALKTYNVIQSMIVINAVDSERVDQDYFFHPRNVGYLQQLIENISQTMFWHVDDKRLNVDEFKEHSVNALARAAEKVANGTVSMRDHLMLHQALKHIESAANDRVWRSLMLHPYICHRVYNMPEDVYLAWSVLSRRISWTSDPQHGRLYHFLIPDRLRTLRNLLARQPFSQIPRMIDYGHAVSEQDEARLHIMKRAYESKANKKQREHRKDVSSVVKADHMTQFIAAQDKLRALTANDQGSEAQGNAMLLASSPLKGVRIGNSTSSKLNYILNEVRLYQSESKFLIFSRSPLTLLYVAESLSLMGVQYKLSSQKPIKMLEQDVTTFESSEAYRVFLMELKHGARGLNLVTASRVIFCEPVWQADVESQAIKRVHRIGQTSPVSVKTLAIRGTAEEVMVARRDALKRGLGNNSGKLPSLTDDSTMRDFIANPTFLPESPAPAVALDFTFLPEYDGPPPPPSASRLVLRIPGLNSPKRTGRLKDSSPTKTTSSTKRARAFVCSSHSSNDDGGPGYVGSPPPSKKPRSGGPSVRFADLP